MAEKTIYVKEVDLRYTTEGGLQSYPIVVIAKTGDEEIKLNISIGQAKWLRDGLKLLIKAEKILIED